MSIQTVLGNIDAGNLGRTLTHEHLTLDFRHFYQPPPAHLANHLKGSISLNNVGMVRQLPYSSMTNLEFYGTDTNEAVLNDVMAYKKFGGGAIVENTTVGLGADLSFFKEVSEKSGVHIIAGTGYYIGDMQQASTCDLKMESMVDVMKQDLLTGVSKDPSIKAGFMGEIASVWPITDFEKCAIRAAGAVQADVGCGVSFHPHRNPAAPFEIMRLYLEAGGRASKAVMSHLDRTLLSESEVLDFCELGSYCQWDLFGVEVSHYQLHPPTDMPSDAQRINRIKLLIDEKKTDRILMSHDIHTKHRLMDFGGHGYSHIINNIIPKMKCKDISDDDIDQITIKNPAEWLQFKA